MTTATLHSHVQRTRFVQHSLAALSGLARSVLNLSFVSPQPASARTAAEAASVEAQKVRNLAHSYSKTDPGFAADLYAAAARHEGLHAD